jgi:hypothetical protein
MNSQKRKTIMLLTTKDTMTQTFKRLRALPSHLGEWQRQENALSCFRHAWAKKPVKSHLSDVQRREQLAREFAETQRIQRENLAKAQAEADRFIQG